MALVFLFVIVAMASRAQSTFPTLPIPEEFVTYSGYEVAMGTNHFKLASNIPQLKGIAITQFGAQVGAVWANRAGKIRTSAGLYYSDGTSRTVDMAGISVAGNLYLLRMLDKKVRFVEPYAIARVGYQRMKFFGTYLADEPITNYSLGKEPELGTLDGIIGQAGLGVDVRLVHDGSHFIHVFAEALTGSFAKTQNSSSKFNDTSVKNPSQFTLGLSFGLSRY